MTISEQAPWRGLYTATALPFNEDLSVDYDAYAEHVAWLAAAGTDGVCPSGSLGEYQTLTPEERARILAAAPPPRSLEEWMAEPCEWSPEDQADLDWFLEERERARRHDLSRLEEMLKELET